MIQCKDSIVILRRSEDRRRICNLSPNRSFAYAQDDKVSLSGIRSQPAGHARRQPDVCGPPPAKAAARTARKSRRTTQRHSYRNHCSAPSAAFLIAIALCACCGQPLQRDGSPERHRCARLLLEFVELCRWQSQCWRHGFHRCARCPLGLSEPGVGSGRALRPASARSCF